MTSQQYQQKYGTTPTIPQQSGVSNVSQPIKMTRAQYQQKYGQPVTPKSLGGFAENIVKSGGKLIGDTVGAVANVFNPDMERNTVANLGKLAVGTAQYFDPTQALGTQFEDKARAVGNFYKDRYGGIDKIGETLYNDPVGVLADVAGVATGAGGIVKGGATLAGKAGMVSKASRLANVGNKLTSFGSRVDPIIGASKGVGKVFSKAKPVLTQRADDIITAGLGNPRAQANAAQKANRSVTSFIDEYNLYDRSSETAKQARKTIGAKFDEVAMNPDVKLQVSRIVKGFDDEIAKLQDGSNGVLADATIQELKELQRRKQMFLDSVTTDSTPLEIGLDEATTFRRNVIDPDVPKSEFGLNPKDAGKAGGVKASRDIFRKVSMEASPELQKLGLDYGMAKELEKIIQSSEFRKNNRQVINFSKLGSAGVGGIVAGAPGVIGGFALEQVVNNPYFIKYASKGLKSAINAKLPANVSKYGSKAYNTGKVGRMNVQSEQDQVDVKSIMPMEQPKQEKPVFRKNTIKYPTLQLKGYR